jgi:hypothetical protein
MAESNAPPPAAPPVLPLLPSNRQIVQVANCDVALCIFQGCMCTRSHIPPNGRWAALKQLLWESEPPSPGPFHATFRRWAAGNMRGRNMKDRVLAILGVYGVYDPTVVTNPSRLQTIARHLKDEMDDAKAARRAALDAERLRQEARQRQNVRQEGALGAIPQGYGVDAPRVAGANEEMQRHFQQAADLLAQNPRSQNNHFRPVVPEEPPRGGDEDSHARMVVTPIPVRGAV